MVYQEVTQVPTAVISNLNPYVYGANYSLRRYSDAAEKALIALGLYNPVSGNSAAYPNKIAGSVVDTAFAKIYADDAWLKYQTVPNAVANPLVATSAGIKNKLRAAPRIVDGGTSAAVTMATAGYHTGLVALPEAYYFYPTATFILGTAAGAFTYETTEGLTGSMVIPIDAPVSGTKVQGPHGLVMDFGVGASVASPRTIKLAKSGSELTNFFTIAPKAAKIKDMIDQDLDSVAHADQVKVVIAPTAGALAVTYDGITLSIAFRVTDDLAAVRAAVVAVAPILLDFDVSAITGVGTETAIIAKDQDAVAWTTSRAVIPDSYRIYVYENNWVFKTANGVSRTGTLYKDVQIGDKIKWTVTPANTGIQVSGYSTIVGLEADYTMPDISDAAEATANQDSQAGVDISAGVVNVTPGADNQNDFDVLACKTYSLFSAVAYPILSVVANVLNDTYTLTVTKGGVKGVAEVSVTNASGSYSRTAVPVEATGANDGQVYVGNNMYIDFKTTGGGDATFYVGDTYSIPASSPWTKITNEIASGTYAGTVDTTYQIEVTRGGVFVPISGAIPGLTTSGTLVSDITGWTGGDVDDEYILTVTTGGVLNAAIFSLKSQRGDNATGISFVGTGAGNAVTVGASGLSLYFSAAGTFVAGEYFVIIVRAARAKIKVTDSAGSDQETSSIVEAGGLISVGLNGAKITFPANTNNLGIVTSQGALTQGDIFTIVATASAAVGTQTLVLADELPADVTAGLETSGDANYAPDRFAADLMLVSASKSIPKEDRDPLVAAGGYNWTANATTVALEAGIKLQDASWVDGMGEMPFIELIHGNLYVEYRSLLLDYADAIYGISDITQVVSKLGPAVAENPLSLGVYSTLENIGRGQCYFTAIPSDNAAGDSAALAKAGLVKYTYALNPAGVTDPARHALLEAHIASMATEIKKRWRIGLVGRELPTETAILTIATNPLPRDWKGTVTADTRTGLFTKVTLDQDGSLLTVLKVGDQVRLQYTTDAWGNISYVTDTVAELESNTVFYLTSGLAAAVPVANKLEVYHPLDVQEQADAVKAMSENYANKRMYVCFPGNLGKYGTYVSAPYGAASVAGVVGSVVPQQGLTNIELNGYDDVPYSYGLFSYDQLNEIASGGTLIIMQDTKGGTVYIRHQISTATKDGNLNTTEMSMVKNLDSISFYFAELLAPFIGRYNVTPELVSVLRTQIQDGLNYLGSLTGVGLLGPQVILTNGKTKIRTLEQHPTLKDRILAVVDVELPAPLNVIELHIVV